MVLRHSNHGPLPIPCKMTFLLNAGTAINVFSKFQLTVGEVKYFILKLKYHFNLFYKCSVVLTAL